MTIKIAMLQMHVEGGSTQKNLSHAEELICKAAGNGADIALLPETMDLGWTHPSSTTHSECIPSGEPCRRLCDTARRHGIYVCAGLTERDGDRVYNSAVVIDRSGAVLCRHRKLNELDIGHQYYAQGDRLNVVHTDLGTLGLMICADAGAKDHMLARSLCYMGADIILSPCAWAVPADHDNAKDPYGDTWRNNYMPVAKEFAVWILGVSNVGPVTGGPWDGWNCIGCSLAVDAQGNEVALGPYGVDAEKVIYVDAEPVERPARGTDWSSYQPQ